jgi:DNA-binding protein HU-beta
MNKAELTDAVAESSDVSKSDVAKVLAGLEEAITKAVTSGEKVTLPGFVSFEATDRAARQGRNPQTGETIQIAASKGVKVSAGSKLKAAVKGS